MDAPAMLSTKHVPENIAAEEGGQQQMHRDEKQHKPVLKKVKDKVKKLKNTIAGHGHGHGNGNGHDHDHGQDTGGSNSTEEDEDDAATREAEVEKGGYQEDVEDKPIFADSSPELHGAPMYDSERIPSAAKEVKHNDAPGMRLGDHGVPAASQEVKHNDAPGVRLGDHGVPAASQEVKHNDAPGVRLGDHGVPAASQEVKHNDAPGVRLGDHGVPAASQEMKRDDTMGGRLGDFGVPAESQEVKRDDATGGRLGDLGVPAASQEVKRDDTPAVRLGDLGGPVVEDPAAPNSRTPTPRGGEDIGTTDVVRNFEAMTVSEQLGAGKMDVDVSKEAEAMPVSDGTGEEWNDAPAGAEYTGSYTDRLKNTAAGTTELGKKLASTVYEKVAGVGTVVASKAQQVTPGFGAGGNAQQDDSSAAAALEPLTAGAGKRNLDSPKEGTPAMYPATGTEELKNATTDATTESAPGATYTDKIKAAASTVYEKVAGSGTAVASKAQQVTPGFGAGGNAQQDDSSAAAALEPMTAGAGKRDLDLPKEGTPATNTGTEGLKNAATDATTESAPGATYTDKIMSAAAGTTEYGKKLASTVYEKVTGVGTAAASKAQQVTPSAGTATPGVGAQDGTTTTTARTVTPGAGGPGNGQDKGVTGVTAYIAEKLRPGDEERSLSEAITGAVQQRKEGVGSTVAKAREVPAQAVTRARGAVTSLTGGNRVSETVQPTTEGNIGEGVAEEGPVLHGEEVGAPRTNTNVM